MTVVAASPTDLLLLPSPATPLPYNSLLIPQASFQNNNRRNNQEAVVSRAARKVSGVASQVVRLGDASGESRDSCRMTKQMNDDEKGLHSRSRHHRINDW